MKTKPEHHQEVKTPFVLTALLEQAWTAGVNTWEPIWPTPPHWWLWETTLLQITNTRIKGWHVPSPWNSNP